jgi:endonuclease/exonuclease/phosphatase family metal-dependent hydrolase
VIRRGKADADTALGTRLRSLWRRLVLLLLLPAGALAFALQGQGTASDPAGSQTRAESEQAPSPSPEPTTSGAATLSTREPAIIPATVLDKESADKESAPPSRHRTRKTRHAEPKAGGRSGGSAIPEGYVEVSGGSTATTGFAITSFNTLGFGHTTGRHSRKADGRTRTGWMISLLRSHGVSIAGLQEFQKEQAEVFARDAGDYSVYPGMSLGAGPVQNSIAWRRADWTLVDAATTAIPYFHGNRIAMPHVLLRNNGTGREIWVINRHYPADARGPANRWRDQATAIDIDLANRLRATGRPAFLLGDMNDRAEFACQFTAGAPFHSPDGAYSSGSTCHLPEHSNVDWIMGSKSAEFSDFVTDRSALVERTSDHPMVRARVRLAAEYDADECVRVKGRSYCPAP